MWWAKESPDPVVGGSGRWVCGVRLVHELPYFYEAAGVWAVLVLVCLAPLVDVVDVLGLVGFFAVVAFGFVLWFSHGVSLHTCFSNACMFSDRFSVAMDHVHCVQNVLTVSTV